MVTGNSSAQQTSIPQTIDEESPNVAATGNGDAVAHHAPMLQVLIQYTSYTFIIWYTAYDTTIAHNSASQKYFY